MKYMKEREDAAYRTRWIHKVKERMRSIIENMVEATQDEEENIGGHQGSCETRRRRWQDVNKHGTQGAIGQGEALSRRYKKESMD